MIFEIRPTGQETVLHNFTGAADGKFLYGGLIRDAQGNFYREAAEDGESGCMGSANANLRKLLSL